MRTVTKGSNKKKTGTTKKPANLATAGKLHQQAFDNSLRANIISTVSTGKIVAANRAACNLLGYSKKELLTRTRSGIFNIKESSFKKMLKQRTAAGRSIAFVTAKKKSGKTFPCEITSAVFVDEFGSEKSISTIVDLSPSILRQKNIDIKKERLTADNIVIARSKQNKIDAGKEKIVADNILLAQEVSDDRLEENKEWIKSISKSSYDVM